MKRMMSLVGAALKPTVGVACAPPAPPPAQLTCGDLQAAATISPGVTFTPQAQTFTLARSSKLLGCTDTLGLGITSGNLLGTSLSFPS